MKNSQSKKECPFCGGRLAWENTFRHTHTGIHEQYRCEVCKKITRIRIDKSIMEIYPTIQDISMEVLKVGGENPMRYSNDSIRDKMFFCSNPRCTNPGIHMDSFLCQMIEKHQKNAESYESCNGVEHSPKWRRRTPCDQSFKITVEIVFKNNEAPESQIP